MSRVSYSSQVLLFSLTAALVSVLYWSGLSGPFFFDDGPALTHNHYLLVDGGQFDNWRTATYSSESGPLRRPLAMLSFTANVFAAGGVEGFPIKLGNLVIHLLCGFLVYLFAKGILLVCVGMKAESTVFWSATLAMLLWLLAPLHVSTVLYAVQRMTQLSALFVLIGLVTFVYRRAEWARLGASAGELIATSLWLMLCTLMAILSKENGIQ